MKIIDFRKLKNRFEFSPICLSMGFFDGVHIGHQKLISDVCFYSKRIDGFSAILTYYNHPKTILDSNHIPFLLLSFEEKMNIISSLGVDFAFVSEFDKEFASITAEKFVSDILVDKLNVKYVCIGKNHRFGKNGLGNEDTIKKFGIEVKSLDLCSVGGENVSSSNIRKFIESGNIELVTKMLGRKLQLYRGKYGYKNC